MTHPMFPHPPVPVEPSAPAPFPVDALPTWLAEYVTALSEAMQVPAELPAMMAMAVTSVATAGQVFVQPKKGWREPCVIYTAVALPPGSLKSPTVAALRVPVDRFEDEMKATARPELSNRRMRREVLERSIAKHRSAATKADTPEEREQAILSAVEEEAQLARHPLLIEPRLTATDASPEELQRLLSVHGGRMALLHDEGGVFDIMHGRLGPMTNLDPWLAGHNGGRLQSDRKGKDGTGETTLVPQAFVTMGFAVQDDVLADLFSSSRLTGRGITARFLYAWPRSLNGYREFEAAEPVPDALTGIYEQRIAGLLQTFRTGMSPDENVVIGLTPSARLAFDAFHKRCELALRPGADLHHLQGWGSKLAGQTLRIAGVLHVLEHAEGATWELPLDVTTMEGAITIAECLITHAQSVFKLGDLRGVADARAVLSWLRDQPTPTVRARDIYRGITRLGVDRTYAAIRVLIEYGWLAAPESDGDEPRGPGRPSKWFHVHPTIAGAPVGSQGLEAA